MSCDALLKGSNGFSCGQRQNNSRATVNGPVRCVSTNRRRASTSLAADRRGGWRGAVTSRRPVWRSSSAVEQGTHKPLAGSSNLPSATTENNTGAAPVPVLPVVPRDCLPRVGGKAYPSLLICDWFAHTCGPSPHLPTTL